MDVENLVAFGQGVAGSDLPNILGKAFYNIFSGIGGAGGTLGLCILLTFVAKSKQLRTLGRLALIPSFFTINEPLIFGVPLILNPVMIIPFMTVPLVQTIVAYLAITSGLVPRLAGVQAPFGIPVFINGFMQGSWKISVLQLVLIVISVLIYYPFFKKLDNDYYQKEKLAATE